MGAGVSGASIDDFTGSDSEGSDRYLFSRRGQPAGLGVWLVPGSWLVFFCSGLTLVIGFLAIFRQVSISDASGWGLPALPYCRPRWSSQPSRCWRSQAAALERGAIAAGAGDRAFDRAAEVCGGRRSGRAPPAASGPSPIRRSRDRRGSARMIPLRSGCACPSTVDHTPVAADGAGRKRGRKCEALPFSGREIHLAMNPIELEPNREIDRDRRARAGFRTGRAVSLRCFSAVMHDCGCLRAGDHALAGAGREDVGMVSGPEPSSAC